MGDQNTRGIFEYQIQCLLDLPFSKWVNASGSLIKDKDRGLLHQDAHQRHELALTHRETSASFSNFGLNPMRECFQPFAFSYFPCHREHLIISDIGCGIADIISHGPRKQKWDLRYDAQLFAILREIKRTDVTPIDQQTSLLIFIKTSDQFRNGRLACASMSNQCKSLSGWNEQVELSQNRFVIRITEIQIVKVDVAL